MDELYSIKGIGFDVDHTLWVNSQAIVDLQRGEIAKGIHERTGMPVLEARERFEALYVSTGSGSGTLMQLGVSPETARNDLRDWLKRADISTVLEQDYVLKEVLYRAREKVDFMWLNTESLADDTNKKLAAMGVDPNIFNLRVYWDQADAQGKYQQLTELPISELRKDTGTIYPNLIRVSGIPAEQLAYVGNSLRDDILPAKNSGLIAIGVGKEAKKDTNNDANIWLPSVHNLGDYFISEGKFIVLEGVSGSGKGTQIRKITDYIHKTDRYNEVFRTRSPSRSVWGRAAKKLNLADRAAGNNPSMHAKEYVELFVGDRKNQQDRIDYNLANGIHVISDRYTPSTVVLQQNEHFSPQEIVKMHKEAGITPADLTIILDLPVQESLRRIDARGDQPGLNETPERLQRAREKYSELPNLLPEYNINIIDASGSPEEVFGRYEHLLEKLLKQNYSP
tara:strand:- start:14085 stop:15440 length:1356 start_codon:yes stop_codon:yes gene_type:complete